MHKRIPCWKGILHTQYLAYCFISRLLYLTYTLKFKSIWNEGLLAICYLSQYFIDLISFLWITLWLLNKLDAQNDLPKYEIVSLTVTFHFQIVFTIIIVVLDSI